MTTVRRGCAYGKIILIGEHAVVWGTNALAAALPIGMTATASLSDMLCIEVPSWGFKISKQDDSIHGEALSSLLSHLPFTTGPLKVTIESEIPARAGLGSSAALAASVVDAIAAANQKILSFDARFTAVQAWESVFHGNPSGIDAALALKGGILMYNKNTGPTVVEAALPEIMVVHSGRPGDTRSTVARFADTMKKHPREGRKRLDRIALLAQTGRDLLMNHATDALGEVMFENHRHLAWFGVSTDELDCIVQTAEQAGALGAKLTGGGGGGSAIVLPGDRSSAVLDALTRAGFRVIL